MDQTIKSRKSDYAIIAGAVIITLGAVLTILKPQLLAYIQPSLTLQPNTTIGEFWSKPPIQLATKIYMFNWTNPEDIHNFAIKPRFEEVGPYTFMQTVEKVNLSWNNNNTVTFSQLRYWYANEKLTNGSLDDEVTSLNLFTWWISHKARNWNYFLTTTISGTISALSPNLHVTRTVKQYIYDGYHDLAGELISYAAFLFPEIPKFSKFGILSCRNGTYEHEGVFNTNTGIDKKFDLVSWNYQNETPAFPKKCARLGQSTGELYSPIESRKADLSFFFPLLCRELLLEYEEDVIVDNTLGYKYSVGKKVLDNGTLVPGNDCYCVGKCSPSGVINTTTCMYGLSSLISLPHFYGADHIYLSSIEGLRPEKENHEAYIIIEPNTGIPLKTVLRLQLNSHIHPIENINVYKNIPDLVFPFVWIEIEFTLPDDLMFLIQMFLTLPIGYSVVTKVLLIVGSFILSMGLIFRPCTMSLYKKVYERKPSIAMGAEGYPLNGCDKNI